MNTYPAFAAAVEGVDLDDLALASGVPTHTIRAVLAGGVTLSPGLKLRLARALDADPAELFRLHPDLEEALAGAPSRHVTDPATLRAIDGPAA